MKKPYIAIFVVSLVTLMIEVLMTRAFDVRFGVNAAYMIITCAMFAFGLSGIYATLNPLPTQNGLFHYIFVLFLLLSVAVLIIPPITYFIPFDFVEIPRSPFRQLAYFGLLYIAIILPFFLSGLIITALIYSYPLQIQPLYFWDLTGAALGCVIFIPFFKISGPGGLLISASGIVLLISAIFSQNRFALLLTPVVGFCLILTPFFFYLPEYFDFSYGSIKYVSERIPLVDSHPDWYHA